MKSKNRPEDSNENISILQNLLISGLTIKEATVVVIDLFFAGVESVRTKLTIYLNKIIVFWYPNR